MAGLFLHVDKSNAMDLTLLKKSIKGLSTIVVLLLLSQSAFSQKIEIKWVEVTSDKIIVHYNLDDSSPNHEYAINLMSSKDNFSAPLTKVTGDVGSEVKPGIDKKIMWAIIDELGNYKGDLELEIRGKVFAPFMKITGFDAKKSYKRGKSYPLVWTSGNMSGQLDIELYKGKERVSREPNVPNTGKFDWFIPGSVKTGNDYKLKFTNTKSRDEVVFTNEFSIKPKLPLLVKVVPVVLIVGAAVALGGGKGGSAGGGTIIPPINNALPGHPETP